MPGYWQSKNTSFAVFSGAIPFGLSPHRFVSWIKSDGGRLLNEIYGRHGLRSIACGLAGPEGGGWFKARLTGANSLRGKRIRFYGLGGKVIEKLGAKLQLLPGGEIYPALESGVIDGTEFSTPEVDDMLGFSQVIKNYYYPGWHQPVSLLELLVNNGVWSRLNSTERQLVETACVRNLDRALSEIPGRQQRGLAKLRSKGVKVRPFPASLLKRLRRASDQVMRNMSAANRDFKRAYQSYQSFR